MWTKKLWSRTIEVATTYTGTFIVVMILNQLLFFGFCLNPVCLIAAMPHVLLITVVVGTFLNKTLGWGEKSLNLGEKAESLAEKVEVHAENIEDRTGRLKNESQAKMDLQRYLVDPDEWIKEQLTRLSAGGKAQRDLAAFLAAKEADRKKSVDETVPQQPIENDSAPFSTYQKKIKLASTAPYTPFSEYGVTSLWHLTHRENIPSILSNGILSNSSVYANLDSTVPVDISDHGVQKRRDRVDPCFKRKVHEYVPLYISIRNPMLYSRKTMQGDLCLIEVALSALNGKDFLVSNGNAASRDTKFYKSYDGLRFLPWDVIHSEYWSDSPDGKREKCSEVLVYPYIEPKYIECVHCQSDDTSRFLRASTGISDVEVRTSKEMYF